MERLGEVVPPTAVLAAQDLGELLSLVRRDLQRSAWLSLLLRTKNSMQQWRTWWSVGPLKQKKQGKEMPSTSSAVSFEAWLNTAAAIFCFSAHPGQLSGLFLSAASVTAAQ